MNYSQPSPTILRRCLDAFVGLPDRIKVPVAVLLALVVHLAILAVVWVFPLILRLLILYSVIPPDWLLPKAAPTPTPQPKKLEVVLYTPTPTPEPRTDTKPPPPPKKQEQEDEKLLKDLFAQLPPERQRDYVDVEGLAKKKNLSKKALLESWRDSVAGSRKQGQGDGPLPSIDGLDNLPFTQFTNREASLGKPENPAEADLRDRTGASPSSPPSADDLPPLFKPKPVDPKATTADKLPETAEPVASASLPTPAPTPKPVLVAKATPPPNVLRVEEAGPDQIPVFLNREPAQDVPTDLAAQRPAPPEPTPKPAPQPTATPAPKPTPVPSTRPTPGPPPTPAPRPAPAKPAKPATEPQSVIVAAKLEMRPNQPRPVPNPGYSPQLRRTRIDGGNLAQGDEGIDAVATPVGRYKKAVSSAVGSRWNYYIQQRMSLLQTGKVLVIFDIDARGKLKSFRIEENTSNSTHAAVVEQCVREAEFDPPPPEALRNGVFEYPMSFNLY